MLALVLALLVRPLVVLLTLGLARLSWAERAFITWSGLKGAVPILLAAFALLGGVAGPSVCTGSCSSSCSSRSSARGHWCRSSPGARHPDARTAAAPVGAVGPARRGTAACARVRGGRRLASGRTHDPRSPARRARLGHARRQGRGRDPPAGSLELRAGDRVLLLAEPEDTPESSRVYSGHRRQA